MAQLITPPICIPASINFGSTTVASTYSNALSPWNGSSFTFNCTFSVLIQETSSYDTNPILQYNANNLSIGMWFGLPNGNCYRIQSITSVNAQGTACVLVLEDVDLYNLVVDNTGNGNNFPPEGFVGLFFTIGSDGIPVITPTEQIRSQIGDITHWLNDLHDRFRFRNYITDFFSLDINDTSYTGIVEGNFVSINSSGKFVKVTGTTENDLLSIAGIVSSADTPEQGNLRVRPLGRVVNNLNILVGSIGDVLYFDPNQVGSLTATKPATGVFPVYIKLSSTSAILKSGGGGASGTAGTAGSSGTAGTSGATGTSGSSGTSGGSGTSGSSGTTGTSGTNGSSGTDGSSGTSGTNGTSGSSGTSGTSATSGSSGTSGTSASSGSSGTSATSGSSGTAGTNGTDGSSGTSATSGTSGSSGTNGTAGTSASSGTAGTSGGTGTAGTSGINGISGGLVYWMNQSINTSSAFGTPTYKQWSSTPTTAIQQTVTASIPASSTGNIQTFATDSSVPNAEFIPNGNWSFVLHVALDDGNADFNVYAEIYTYTIGGVSTLIGTTNPDNVIYNGGLIQQIYTDVFIPYTDLTTTDRLYCVLKATNNTNQTHNILFYTEGQTYYSYTQTSFNAPSGTSGTSGVNGTSGTSGTNGTSGTSASSGSSGTAGTNGTSASSGTSGTNGTDGSSGSSGTTGTSGTNGTSGSSGTSASSGSSGTTGTSGTNGTTGTSGTSGTNGTSGSSATSGATGVSGTSGTSGADGSSGATGSSGSSGTSGGSGTSGSSGTSGTAGTSGSSGYASSSARSVEVFTATAGQTTFTVTGGYNIGMVDVYVNGVKFVNGTDFTATNGTTVVMTTGLAAGNIVEIDNLLTAYLPTNALRTVTTFTATAGQTTFTVTYTQGLVDVYYNGSCLAQSEYTATNGTSIILATACQVNDIVVVYAYSYAVGAYSGIGGSGTATQVAYFASSSTINSSSNLYWDNTNNRLGIGNSVPAYTLDVSGTVRGTTSAYFATTSGSVGIGTTNTNNVKLEVSATTVGGAEYSAFTTNQDGGVASKYSFWRTYGGGSTAFRAAYIANYNQDDSNSSANDQRLVFATKSGTAEPTTKMTITGSGNVGINTSSPATTLHALGPIRSQDSRGGSLAAVEISGGSASANPYISVDQSNPLTFITGATERMRITSDGNVGVGLTGVYSNVRFMTRGVDATASNYAFRAETSAAANLMYIRNDGLIVTGLLSGSPYNYTTGSAANMYVSGGGELQRSTSSLKYKTDVKDYDKGLSEVLQMRPVYYKGKNDGDTQFAGLIAEEIHDLGLTEFVQYAEDGTPDALAYSNMIALLTKAIQEMNTKIIELEKLVATK